MATQNIKKGDIVEVQVWPYFRKGEVLSAFNYGTDAAPDWYITFQSQQGIVYWKQSIDGGKLIGHWSKDEPEPAKKTFRVFYVVTQTAWADIEAISLDKAKRKAALMGGEAFTLADDKMWELDEPTTDEWEGNKEA